MVGDIRDRAIDAVGLDEPTGWTDWIHDAPETKFHQVADDVAPQVIRLIRNADDGDTFRVEKFTHIENPPVHNL